MQMRLYLALALVARAIGADLTWPGSSSVSYGDNKNEFDENMSDGEFDGTDYMWAIQNEPSQLYRLHLSGTIWNIDSKVILNYPDGSGKPDSEDITTTDESKIVYVSVERNGEDSKSSDISQPGILRYNVASYSNGQHLSATNFWDMTSMLPKSDPNKGLEALTWIPDSFLVANGFYDQNTGKTYAPLNYKKHGNGLFFAGLESNGYIYAVALTIDAAIPYGQVVIVQTIQGALDAIMSLEFDPATGYLWGGCDNSCDGKMSVYAPASTGKYHSVAVFKPPTGLSSSFNIEGFSIAHTGYAATSTTNAITAATNTTDYKSVVWFDDSCDGGHAVYEGTIPVGDFLGLKLIL
jgi:hypothetical protein